MRKIDPKSVELMHQILQQTFGRYTVAFIKTMSGANGGTHYDVVIQDVEQQFDSMLVEFSTGSGWKIPPAIHVLECVVSDYLTVTVDPDPEAFELEVWRRLENQAEKFKKSALFHVLDHIDILLYELGIGFEFVTPFLIDKATLDGDEIPVRGECSL